MGHNLDPNKMPLNKISLGHRKSKNSMQLGKNMNINNNDILEKD
jgi:hypothetical protein